MAYETGFSTTLSATLSASATSMEVSTAPTVTAGVMKVDTGNNVEWIYYSGVSGTTLQNLVRGLSKTASTRTAGTGKKHIAGVPVKLVAHHTDLYDMDDNTLRIGDATDSDKKIQAYNADANKPFLMYDASENKWVFSNDGVNTSNIGGSTATFTAGNGIDITAGVIDLDIKANRGLVITSTELDAKIKANSGFTVDSNGFQLDSLSSFDGSSQYKAVLTNANGQLPIGFDAAGVVKMTTGEAYSAGDALYLKQSDGRVWKADSDGAESTFGFIGFALTASTGAGESQWVQTTGMVTGLSGLTIGIEYYIGATAGGLSTTPGTNGLKVGRAMSTTTLLIDRGVRAKQGSGSATTDGTTGIVLGFKPSYIWMTGSMGTLPITPTAGSDNSAAIGASVHTDGVSWFWDLSESAWVIGNNTSSLLFVDNATDSQSWTVTLSSIDALGFTISHQREADTETTLTYQYLAMA